MPKKPIINATFTIQRKQGPAPWHFVELRDIPQQFVAANGLVRISGWIDEVEIRQFNLLPMKNGNKMLVIKAAIRKSIGKKAGDQVLVKLYPDDTPVEIPEEILDSLLQSPRAYDHFMQLTDSNKKYYIDWVQDAKQVDTKVNRLLKLIRQMEQKRKFWDWPSERHWA
ncbi:MAG: YdeI/OmpD-associated family protein [Sphingobacteriales bacterium]